MESSHSNAVNDCWSRCAHAPPRPFTPLPARAPRQTAALALAYAYRCDERAGGARALRTDRGERLAVRRSPTRFRCAFFGPSQLHARRSVESRQRQPLIAAVTHFRPAARSSLSTWVDLQGKFRCVAAAGRRRGSLRPRWRLGLPRQLLYRATSTDTDRLTGRGRTRK